MLLVGTPNLKAISIQYQCSEQQEPTGLTVYDGLSPTITSCKLECSFIEVNMAYLVPPTWTRLLSQMTQVIIFWSSIVDTLVYDVYSVMANSWY